MKIMSHQVVIMNKKCRKYIMNEIESMALKSNNNWNEKFTRETWPQIEQAEERINELEYRSIEFFEFEIQKEKNRASETCWTQPSIGTMRHPEGEERNNGAKSIFTWRNNVRNFPKFYFRKERKHEFTHSIN